MIRRALTFEEEHLEALHTGSEITRWFRKDREPEVLAVTPEAVINVLHRAGIRFVLMGTHGINVYRDEARATSDVDVLVPKKWVRKAVRVLEKAFPNLELNDRPEVTRFLNPVTQKVVIDVMKPTSEVMRLVFRHSTAIGETHRIPELEMAIIAKFVAMLAPTRRRVKRTLDAADLMNMIETNRHKLRMDRLEKLADRVKARGSDDIRQIIDDIDNNRPIEV